MYFEYKGTARTQFSLGCRCRPQFHCFTSMEIGQHIHLFKFEFSFFFSFEWVKIHEMHGNNLIYDTRMNYYVRVRVPNVMLIRLKNGNDQAKRTNESTIESWKFPCSTIFDVGVYKLN